ncbi:hypothetical protein QT932_019295 [Xanthomonas campestris pv. campestris]|uniref:AbiU2 domain-containing protein n=3 Tax=Xanthomonas campestris TaxID=339 RepID=UPI001CDCD15E|nr:hypothetical protein [Xanthomonas campestris]MDM7868224.1 hypothetical protein [Xanthomonas campestris pv. campestris]MEB1626135.1 hypothetical protein [Xanthomonas campestris pv. campestris]
MDELDQRVRQIDGWIRALTGEVHFLGERVHLLKPLVQDRDVQAAMKAKLDQTQGVELWNHLVPLLGQDYIRELARLFLDKGEKTGSLTNTWRKLQLPGVRERYRDSYGRMFDYLWDGPDEYIGEETRKKWRQRDIDENMAKFDEKWGAVSEAIKELKIDPVAISVRLFRDKHHSHWEMQKLGEEPKPFDISTLRLTYQEIFDFGDRCLKILAMLGELLTHAHWEPDEFVDISAEQGRTLWMTLAK